MQKIIIVGLLSFLSSTAWAEQKYVDMFTRFDLPNCEIYFYKSHGEDKKYLKYTSKSKKIAAGIYDCVVHIPRQEFEKYFDYCFLVGVNYTPGKGSFSRYPLGVLFSRPSQNAPEFYEVYWRDAAHISGNFTCISK